MSAWQKCLTEWNGSRRLRIGVGVVLVVCCVHLAFSRSESISSAAPAYRADLELLARLEGAAADATWPQRAEQASLALASVESRFTSVESGGEAQAELQALLAQQAESVGFSGSRIRTESASELADPTGVIEVVGRFDASGAPAAVDALLIALASTPWIRVERIDIADGDPTTVMIVVRGYFLTAGSDPGDSP